MKLTNKIICFVACATLSPLSFSATLLEIYEQALENDPQLRADKASYEANKEAYAIARSRLLPQIGASASYSDSSRDTESSGTQVFQGIVIPSAGVTITSGDSETTSYSASLSQPLFDMNAWYSFKQGAVQSEQAKAEFETAQRAMIIRVAEVYLNVLRAIDNLESTQAQQAALESQLEQTRQRFEVGLTAITEVHEAQSLYDDIVATLLQAEGNLRITFQAFEVLTGSTPESLAPIVENFPVSNPTPEDRQSWVNFALENNSSLKASKLAKEAGLFSAKASKSNHLPTLSASINYSNSDGDSSSTVTNSLTPGAQQSTSNSINEGTTFALSLDIPLYSGGRTSAQRRQAYQQYIRADEMYDYNYRTTSQSARSLHLAVTTGVATVTARQQAIVSAESRLEATRAGYEVGTRNIVEVLEAQQALFRAQLNYSNALYQYIFDTLRLKEVAGLLGPEDIIELNQYLDAQNQISLEVLEAPNQ